MGVKVRDEGGSWRAANNTLRSRDFQLTRGYSYDDIGDDDDDDYVADGWRVG